MAFNFPPQFERALGIQIPDIPSPDVGGIMSGRSQGAQVPSRMGFRDLGRLGFLEAPRRGRGAFGRPATLNTDNFLSMLLGRRGGL